MTRRKPPALPDGVPPLLTPAEVGKLHRVDPKTVTRWANQERIESVRIGNGLHRRYPSAQFAELLAVTGWPL